jgi:hypothetical protein
MTDFIKHKVADAISLTVTDTGKTMAERITDEACSLLASKIDDVVTKITNGTLSKLREKIDSEEFSEKFVNVLQQKLIDGMPPNDPFLNKFIKLFDNIIEKAINNYGKPVNIPPEDITNGIADYLKKNVPEFWESDGQKLYTEAAEKVLSEFKTQPDQQSQMAFIEALRKSVVTPSILGQVTFNSALYDAIEKYKTKPISPEVTVAVPATESSKGPNINEINATPAPSALPESVVPSPSALPEATANKGGRGKRTRKVPRKSMSRKNRRNRANMLTKRNLFL